MTPRNGYGTGKALKKTLRLATAGGATYGVVLMPNKLPRLGTSLTRRDPLGAGEPPLRAELFGVEQLARHAQTIAGEHRIVTGRGWQPTARPVGAQRGGSPHV